MAWFEVKQLPSLETNHCPPDHEYVLNPLFKREHCTLIQLDQQLVGLTFSLTPILISPLYG